MKKNNIATAAALRDLAATTVFPVHLSPDQRKKADEELSIARKASQAAVTEETKLVAGLLQLRFQIEDYLKAPDYDSNLSFGYFLKKYVELINKKRKVFAEDIDIDPTLLSQLINLKRDPPAYVMVRLEIHSNNAIPAGCWFRLVVKEKEYQITSDKMFKKREKEHVQNKLKVSI